MELTLKAKLLAWRRVIFALFLRDWQSKFNDKLGLAWAFIEPFLFVFFLSFLRSLIRGDDVHSIPVFLFMMIGLMGLQSFLACLNSVPNSLKQSKPLLAFRQVQPIAALLSSAFTEFSIKMGVIVLIFVGVYLLQLDLEVANPLMLIMLYTTLWLMGISIGLIIGIATTFIPELNKVKALLSRPLMFISCVFFSLQDIPKEYWHWFTWNPLVHFIELARYACYPSYGDAGVSLLFIFEVTVISLFFSLAIYHISWKRVLAR